MNDTKAILQGSKREKRNLQKNESWDMQRKGEKKMLHIFVQKSCEID